MSTQIGTRLKNCFDRIQEIAVEVAVDYPDITACGPMEQLTAIRNACIGTELANRDLHALVTELRTRLGLSAEEVFEIHEELQSRSSQPEVNGHAG